MSKNKHYRSATTVRGHYRNGAWIPEHGRSGTFVERDGDNETNRIGRGSLGLSADAECYPSYCLWCGDPVYYFRSEKGGFALFDALGKPWPVHCCWAERQREVVGFESIPRSQTQAKELTNILDVLGDPEYQRELQMKVRNLELKLLQLEKDLAEKREELGRLVSRMEEIEKPRAKPVSSRPEKQNKSKRNPKVEATLGPREMEIHVGRTSRVLELDSERIDLCCGVCGMRSIVDNMRVVNCPKCGKSHWRD